MFQRDTERVKLCIYTAQRKLPRLAAGRTRELRERESCKVICVRLVEGRQGSLANFVVRFRTLQTRQQLLVSGGFGLWNGARGQGDVQNHMFSAEKRPKIGGLASR